MTDIDNQYEDHPISQLVPPMTRIEYEDIRESINRYDLRMAIMLFEGKILDGRHRYRSCIETGRQPRFEDFQGTHEEAVAYVIGMNLDRRNLSNEQKALAAARLADYRLGDNQHTGDKGTPTGGTSQADAAKTFNVPLRSLQRAKRILDHGESELVEMFERGDISGRQAEAIAAKPRAKQKRILAAAGSIGRIASFATRVQVESNMKRAKRSHDLCLCCNAELPKTILNFVTYMRFLSLLLKDDGDTEAMLLNRHVVGMIDEIEETEAFDEYKDLETQVFETTIAAPQIAADIAHKLQVSKDEVVRVLEMLEDYGNVQKVPQGGKTDGARGGRKILWEPTSKGLAKHREMALGK